MTLNTRAIIAAEVAVAFVLARPECIADTLDAGDMIQSKAPSGFPRGAALKAAAARDRSPMLSIVLLPAAPSRSSCHADFTS